MTSYDNTFLPTIPSSTSLDGVRPPPPPSNVTPLLVFCSPSPAQGVSPQKPIQRDGTADDDVTDALSHSEPVLLPLAEQQEESTTPRPPARGPSAIIRDFLYLGSESDANDQTMLRELNIRHMLCCAADVQKPHHLTEQQQNTTAVITFTHVMLNDKVTDKLDKVAPIAFNAIDTARDSGERILVYCKMGVSRSVAVTVAYLMNYCRFTYTSALGKVRSVRPQADPNLNFVVQLIGRSHDPEADWAASMSMHTGFTGSSSHAYHASALSLSNTGTTTTATTSVSGHHHATASGRRPPQLYQPLPARHLTTNHNHHHHNLLNSHSSLLHPNSTSSSLVMSSVSGYPATAAQSHSMSLNSHHQPLLSPSADAGLNDHHRCGTAHSSDDDSFFDDDDASPCHLHLPPGALHGSVNLSIMTMEEDPNNNSYLAPIESSVEGGVLTLDDDVLSGSCCCEDAEQPTPHAAPNAPRHSGGFTRFTIPAELN